MADEFHVIVITPERNIDGEASKIVDLLDMGHHAVHIRKPSQPRESVESLLEKIPGRYHGRLKLHDHQDLYRNYPEIGIHLNNRWKQWVAGRRHSISCHSLDETDGYSDVDYRFLSPIFDSISKPGYNSRFNIADLKGKINGRKIVALGGVTRHDLSCLCDNGFYGAALLGDVWRDFDNYVDYMIKNL